jgi:rhodanese-related sulfurtransferase
MKEITPRELHARIAQGNAPFLVDVREAHEREIASLGGLHIPLAQLAERHTEIPKDVEVVIYCRSGGRSGRACEGLAKSFGFTNLVNLVGGTLRWSDDVDPAMEKY